MSILDNYTTATRLAAASNTGLCIFNTDNDSIEVSDGTSYLSYASDGFTIGASTHSAAFDGTNDRVEIGNAIVLNGASAFSLSFWIKSSTTPTSTFDLFSSGDGFTNGIFLYLTPSGIDFGVGSGSGWNGISYGTSLTDGTWKHLAFTFNTNTFAFYLNGSQASVTAVGGGTVNTTVSTAGNGSHIASRVDDTREYEGYMDDFAIFNAALTADEALNIKAHSIYPTTKIEHLYKFDNNYNDSIGALNGTEQGNPQLQSSVVRP